MVRIVSFFLHVNLWSCIFPLALASLLTSASWQNTQGWFLSGPCTEDLCSSTWAVNCFVKEASCNLIYFVLRRCLNVWVVSCLSHTKTFSCPEIGSGVYMIPEVLLKGAGRSQNLLQPGIDDANTATMSQMCLFSLGWALWGKYVALNNLI